MTDLPKKLKDALNNEGLQNTVKKQPGSLRSNAMVLGTVALEGVKKQAEGEIKDNK